jgi:hypothetical protein
MPVAFEVTILGDRVLSRALSRYADKINDFRPAWDSIHLDFVRIEEEQFNTQGGRSGTVWAPLSPTYAAWKEKYFPGRPILQLTTAMWSQFAVGTGMVVEKTPLSLRMAPTLPCPRFHQQGTRTMPARKVVQLTEADKMGWMKILHNYSYDKAKEEHLL